MTTILIITVTLAFVIVYSIHKGYGVRAALKWFGASISFEADKEKRP